MTLLDISKLEVGRIELIPVHYRLVQSINHASSLLRGLADAKSLQYELTTYGDMNICLYGDDIRLRQILINLLSNAIKFTEKGVVSLIISIHDDFIKFVVKDSGIGIKAEDIPGIFDPFRQLDRLKNRNHQRTGLGLTICHDLTMLMDGSIHVESIHGQETSFILTIPKILGDETLLEQDYVEQKPFMTKDVRVLVVDDMDINLYVVKALLESYGVNITTAKSGAEALLYVQDIDFDFVFMDYYMPVMDGLETTKAIRALGSRFIDLPIIALTANAMSEDKVKCHEATMNDFLSKPIERKKLYNILERWIASEKRFY